MLARYFCVKKSLAIAICICTVKQYFGGIYTTSFVKNIEVYYYVCLPSPNVINKPLKIDTIVLLQNLELQKYMCKH